MNIIVIFLIGLPTANILNLIIVCSAIELVSYPVCRVIVIMRQQFADAARISKPILLTKNEGKLSFFCAVSNSDAL